MKMSGIIIAASIAAATATAISSSGMTSNFQYHHEDGSMRKSGELCAFNGASTSDKFAPRFDGLRFIETLITAHR